MKVAVILIASTAALALTACGGSGAPAQTVTVTVTATPASAPTPSGSPSSAPSTSEPASTEGLKLGAWAKAPDGFRTRVIKVDPTVASSVASEASGGRWYGALVESCIAKGGEASTISWNPWAVSDTQAGNYPASSATYRAFPVPEYPFSEGAVNAGTCKRGWIVFDVSKPAKIVGVDYANDQGFTASWVVS